MKICIIGAGFTGLSAGFKLAKQGHEVVIFESSSTSGGLALGFKEKEWSWSLEEHYHHLFKTDYAIQELAKELNHKIVYTRPKTSTYYKGSILQIDSPLNLLKFNNLKLLDRIRTGIVLAYLKLNNSWKNLEKKEARKFIIQTMGKNSWEVLWQPLLEKKFGKYAKEIPASWFWARVKSRTTELGYPNKGFRELAKTIERNIQKNKGTFYFNTKVINIKKKNGKFLIKTDKNSLHEFDKVICTMPTNLFSKITYGLNKKYLNSLQSFDGLGAINLVLVLKDSFLTDGTYWLNINDKKIPFLCIVEHTNFINKKKYNNKRIIYIGNYLEKDNKYFNFSAKQLLNEYFPHLKTVNKNFRKSSIERIHIFKALFAQPIVRKNYSTKIPPMKTPIDGLYLANIQQVYPWDRGTNYAVDLGNKVSKMLLKEND